MGGINYFPSLPSLLFMQTLTSSCFSPLPLMGKLEQCLRVTTNYPLTWFEPHFHGSEGILQMQEYDASLYFLSSLPSIKTSLLSYVPYLTKSFPTRGQILRDKKRGLGSSEDTMLGTAPHIFLSLPLSESISGFTRTEPTKSEGICDG